MRRPNLATIVEFLITVVVTLRTRIVRAFGRTKLRTTMLRMTIYTPDSGRIMWLDHRRLERLGRMTRSTSLLHVSPQRMAVCARTRVWCRGDRRNDAELRECMSFRERRR